MSLKTAKTLQIIAFALFAFALLLSVVSIFAQNLFKSLFGAPSDAYDIRVIPYQPILYCFVRTVLALIYLLIICGHPTRKGTIAITIVMTILFVLLDTVISPVVGTTITFLTGNSGGALSLAATNAVVNGVQLITRFFTIPAALLMFLSLGGACGKDYRLAGRQN